MLCFKCVKLKMIEYSEDNLLETFKLLNIDTGDLNPNVIKAWFDTDCKKTKYLLQWICSLTEKNSIPPILNQEYEDIKNVVACENVEKFSMAVAEKLPDIFEYELNSLDVKTSEYQIVTLKKQCEGYEHKLEINEQINRNLKVDLLKLESQQIDANVKLNNVQGNCYKLSLELEERHEKLLNQIKIYQSYILNYAFSPTLQFITNMNILEYEDTFAEIVGHINSIVLAETHYLEESLNKSFDNAMFELQERIFESNMVNLLSKMEIEKMHKLSKFLNSYDHNKILNYSDSGAFQISIESKQKQVDLMLEMTEKICLKLAEQQLGVPKLRYSQDELKLCQFRLSSLNKLEDGLRSIFIRYILVSILMFQEKSDIQNSDKFIKNIFVYINGDLQNCAFRNEAMLNKLEEFENFKMESIDNKIKMVNVLGKIVSNLKPFSLNELVEQIDTFTNDSRRLRDLHFNDGFKYVLLTPKDLTNNIHILHQFLKSGATSKIPVVTPSIKATLKRVHVSLTDQHLSVKAMTKIFQQVNAKFSNDKWLHHRALLWMYFIYEPQKLLFVLEQLKEEYKRLKEMER